MLQGEQQCPASPRTARALAQGKASVSGDERHSHTCPSPAAAGEGSSLMLGLVIHGVA